MVYKKLLKIIGLDPFRLVAILGALRPKNVPSFTFASELETLANSGPLWFGSPSPHNLLLFPFQVSPKEDPLRTIQEFQKTPLSTSSADTEDPIQFKVVSYRSQAILHELIL